MKRILGLGVALAVCFGGAAAAAPAASAATSYTHTACAYVQSVTASGSNFRKFTVVNVCSYTTSAKLDAVLAYDTDCKSIPAYGTTYWITSKTIRGTMYC